MSVDAAPPEKLPAKMSTRGTLDQADAALRRYESGPDAGALLALNFGFARARVLNTAIELDIFTELAGQPRSAADLARALGCSQEGMLRLLGAMTELGLAEEAVGGQYTVTPVSRAYLVPEDDRYLGEHFQAVLSRWDHWACLTEVVRSECRGEAVNALTDRTHHRGLLAGGFSVSIRLAAQAASRLEIPSAAKILDFVAGSGEWGIALAMSHDDVTVTAHDEPALLDVARTHVREFGLGDRFGFVASESFYDPPFRDDHFDVAVLSHVSRFVGPEVEDRLVRACARVLRPGGKMIIADIMAGDPGEPLLSRGMINLSLFVNTMNGEIASRGEHLSCMWRAGLKPSDELSAGPISVLVGEK
jgi:SAM-dependent methyltransferase